MKSLSDVSLSTVTECLLSAATLNALGIIFLAYLLYVSIPRFRLDYFLSELPTMKGNIPFLGHSLQLYGPAPWTKMAQWSLYPNKNTSHLVSKEDGEHSKKVNRIVFFNVAGTRFVYINHPSLIKRVLLTNQRNYPKALEQAYKHFMCVLGTGLVTAEGKEWKTGRLLLSGVMRVDILEEIPEMTLRAVLSVTNKLDHMDKSNPFVDICEEFRHMTLQVIGESCLSFTPEETDRIFSALYLPIMSECNKRVWEPWRAFMPFLQGCRMRNQCLYKLDKCLSEIIRERWNRCNEGANEGKTDILDLCIAQLGEITTENVRKLRDDVKTILLAGHETSASLLTWTMYETIRNPSIRQRIVEEARELFDPENCQQGIQTPYGLCGIPSLEQISKMVYTPAALRESLRKHSVVPIVVRYALKDDVFTAADSGLSKDVRIPAGSVVAVGIEAVHNNPEVWENPERFDPERFIDAEIANDTSQLRGKKKQGFSKTIDPYGFIPFINGPRNCLGQHFAMVEAQVALAFLHYKWDLSLFRDPMARGGDNWEDEVGRHHDFDIPQAPHNGLKVCGVLRA